MSCQRRSKATKGDERSSTRGLDETTDIYNITTIVIIIIIIIKYNTYYYLLISPVFTRSLSDLYLILHPYCFFHGA
ncbi:hypothetical protein L6452_17093 [Arctium lappa]|uniref:Uncharacterized protein n=1 Tax=Arctium lappa TaxID=4217 RepID=A0ACB9C2G4_ARCLA|nr:hypothetical protein L6452_17093 [Arctium lappa]